MLQAAVQVLAREGARRFTTARIAEVAGVSVGSLYQYFPNKTSIVFRIQLDEWEATNERLVRILSDPARPPLERLRVAIRAFLQSECEEASLRSALADAAPSFRHAPEAAVHRRAAFRTFLSFSREVLPGVARRQRLRAIDLVVMTAEAAGHRVSEERRPSSEVEVCAEALGDMICAYLSHMRTDGMSPSPDPTGLAAVQR